MARKGILNSTKSHDKKWKLLLKKQTKHFAGIAQQISRLPSLNTLLRRKYGLKCWNVFFLSSSRRILLLLMSYLFSPPSMFRWLFEIRVIICQEKGDIYLIRNPFFSGQFQNGTGFAIDWKSDMLLSGDNREKSHSYALVFILNSICYLLCATDNRAFWIIREYAIIYMEKNTLISIFSWNLEN